MRASASGACSAVRISPLSIDTTSAPAMDITTPDMTSGPKIS